MLAASQNNTVEKEVRALAVAARAAAHILAAAPPAMRTKSLQAGAAQLRANKDLILKANALDVTKAEGKISPAMIDRLRLTEARIESIAKGLEDVAAQPDPVGKVQEEWTRPNGLRIQRVGIPLGVVGMIYESRPNVTAEASSIALRGGNAIVLRCGSDCLESSKAIATCLQYGLSETGLPRTCVQIIPISDRAAVGALLSMSDMIDIIVPRGGRELIERVERESRIPLLRQYEGICHVYIDAHADIEKAKAIAVNAKMRRVSICGSAECVLLDSKIINTTGVAVIKALLDAGCEVRGDETIQALDTRVKKAESGDWGHEFLEPIIAARIVNGVDGAAEYINAYSSHHTDSIITENDATAKTFCAAVDSAIVMVNASTQFADGGEFGFGGEVGIATGRLHARGPIGAAQLTTYKYIVLGNGQTRP